MPAFNARLKPKEVFGMPMLAAVALTLALVFLVLAMIVPMLLKFVFAPLCVGAVAVGGIAMWKGDELQWWSVELQARREDGCVTSEVLEIE